MKKKNSLKSAFLGISLFYSTLRKMCPRKRHGNDDFG